MPAMVVAKLGVDNGFLHNDQVKIQLPALLEQARPILKMTGRGQQLDELVISMNHAAEAAVPMAKPLRLHRRYGGHSTHAIKIYTIPGATK
jgi:hypothetical protein